MSKAITKDYLVRQLHNFEDDVLDEKYLQLTNVLVNNTPVVPDTTHHTVNIDIPEGHLYKIAEQSVAETGYLKTYTLQANTGAGGAYEDVSGAAKINIPKDFLVKSVTLETCTVADVPVAGYVVGDKYIDFVINTVDDDETGTHIYLLVSDLVDVYEPGDGIDITSGEISVAPKTAGGIAVDSNGVSVALATNGGLAVDANGLAVDAATNGGLAIDASGVSVALKTNGGLAVDANGVYIDFEDTDIDFSNWDNYSV